MKISKNISIAAITLVAIVGCGGSGTGSLSAPKSFDNHIYISTLGAQSVLGIDDMLGTNPNEIKNFAKGNAMGFVIDSQNRMIVACGDSTLKRITPGTGAVETFGSFGAGKNQFNTPTRIALDSSGRIYVADWGNQRIVRINDLTGAGWITRDLSPYSSDQKDMSESIAIDSSDRIYVGGLYSCKLYRFNNMSDLSPVSFGSKGSGVGQYRSIAAIGLDSSGRILVCDVVGTKIVRIDDMTGNNYVALGTEGEGSNQFIHPSSVKVDASGHIYVADADRRQVIRFNDMNGAGWTTFGGKNSIPNLDDILVR